MMAVQSHTFNYILSNSDIVRIINNPEPTKVTSNVPTNVFQSLSHTLQYNTLKNKDIYNIKETSIMEYSWLT